MGRFSIHPASTIPNAPSNSATSGAKCSSVLHLALGIPGMNQRFQQAIALIDAENSRDPNIEIIDGQPIAREVLYSQRLTEWLLRLDPAASEPLQLAARSQHICRWKIPRAKYPATRAGYHQWKNDLKKFHADLTSQILAQVGYDASTVTRVHALNLKEGFPHDPETRTLEDALCLVFLQFQFAPLAERAESEKVINALRKSWTKMSANGREAALTLPFSPFQRDLLDRALANNQVTS
jgi:hypothetical protein